MVFGGNYHVGPHYTTYTAYDDILFLDLNSQGHGWFKMNGLKLPRAAMIINGGIVKDLSASNCDMMFTMYDTTQQLLVCKGNYTWTTTPVTPGVNSWYNRFTYVGINALSLCL